ncbi:MAG: hypothetical protein EBZ77_17275, partial [Chitinophagia bacterium]|nr:hypothetical protein [Chitinophagia bacterium]
TVTGRQQYAPERSYQGIWLRHLNAPELYTYSLKIAYIYLSYKTSLMKNILLITVFAFLSLGSLAQQNLVLNPSFEQLRHCPIGPMQIGLSRHWDAIDSGVNADSVLYFVTNGYFPAIHDTCITASSAHCPVNDFYYQYPRTGHAMVGFIPYYNFYAMRIYTGDTFLSQHYVQGRLSSTLAAGVNYCVTFYVNMCELSPMAINKFAAYLDDGSIDTARQWNVPQTQYRPQIEETAVISDSVNWVKVQGNFISNGTERFITIGVFSDTATITKQYNISGVCRGGYYLLDDVSVIESNANAFAGNDTSIRAGDTITRGQSVGGEGMPCYWYVLGSSTPIDSGGTLHAHPTTTTSYVIKMDLCGRVTYDTVKIN